jgi:hypothetical protein
VSFLIHHFSGFFDATDTWQFLQSFYLAAFQGACYGMKLLHAFLGSMRKMAFEDVPSGIKSATVAFRGSASPTSLKRTQFLVGKRNCVFEGMRYGFTTIHPS